MERLRTGVADPENPPDAPFRPTAALEKTASGSQPLLGEIAGRNRASPRRTPLVVRWPDVAQALVLAASPLLRTHGGSGTNPHYEHLSAAKDVPAGILPRSCGRIVPARGQSINPA